MENGVQVRLVLEALGIDLVDILRPGRPGRKPAAGGGDLQAADPDAIAVFGTSLIRGPLLAMGRLGLFNLHGGLSPRYRGADCTFWALYNGEPENVGCTLHRIDAGIDTQMREIARALLGDEYDQETGSRDGDPEA